ncbi:unnamed protein product, partial [Pocillopora meandrina]
SGIAVDNLTELETLMDEIIEQEKLAKESRDSKRLRQANKLQRKCEKRPWSDLDRQKKYLKLRVIKGSRPNDGGVEMVQ